MVNYSSPDLTQHAPRSPRVRLGGYVILPRCLDKCRATIAGKNGEYHYACPLDQLFLTFAGIDPNALKTEVAKGLSDGEVLAWVEKNAKNKRLPWEIDAWSSHQDRRAPSSNDYRGFLSKILEGAKASKREDIATWFEALDVDDYATFGGKP